MIFVLAMFLMMVSVPALPEAGMIPFDSPAGEIGGRGHWYALRTMKGIEYWEDPALLTDVKMDESGDYHIAGEPPLALLVLLHEDYYTNDEPWRHALDEIRQVEQIFRNSGVPIRFIVNHIETVPDLPLTVEQIWGEVQHSFKAGALADRVGADMVIVLAEHKPGLDPYCGITSMPSSYSSMTTSVSACGPRTLAHEMGHQFGLKHSHSPVDASTPFQQLDPEEELKANRGYCVFPPGDESTDCIRGTVMSYAANRLRFFSNANATYKGERIGDETSDAVRYLNKVKTGRALTSEIRSGLDISFEPELEIIID